MIRLKEFLKTRKGKTITITAAALIICIAVLLVIFLNRPVAVKSNDNANVNYATAVKIDKTVLDLKTGDHDTLYAEVTPDNAKDKTVHWASSDKSVATVSDGLITAQGEGTAEITASSINGKTDSCSVTVSALSTTTSSADTSSSGSNSTPASSSNSGSTKQATPAKGGTTTKKPTTTTNPSTKTNTSTGSNALPVNKDIKNTVDGCNIWYNPYYRSAQVFVDVTDINQKYYNDNLFVKVYRNGAYDSEDSGDCGFIGKGRTNIDCIVCANEKSVADYFVPLPTSFEIKCYHNDTWFKTIKFSVNEKGFT